MKAALSDVGMSDGDARGPDGPVRCCIVGGGPAGMMLGLLLARAGVEVVVLEKHADFLRDFRGDTIHPSTLEVLHELGILDRFLALPHQKVRQLGAWVGDRFLVAADFGHLPTRCQFIAFMPQWDFLDFLAGEARRYPTFRLRMRAEVTDLIADGDRIVGVRADTTEGAREFRSDLTVAADGRSSLVRERAGLEVEDVGAPMDVLWFRFSRRADDPVETMGRFDTGRVLVMINRGTYWQFGYVIPKGGLDELRRRGIDAFRAEVGVLAPFLGSCTAELHTWDDVKLLTVKVDRLCRWYRPGLLCIGDAAHAMSPVGGVGINLAIQDAVASANILAAALRDGTLTTEHLARVQERREPPARLTQRVQVFIQNRVITRVLAGTAPIKAPLALRLLGRVPVLRRIPGRLVGLGVRPEHVTGG